MSKERTISGIKVVVSGETYDEYKGTLQEQLEELHDFVVEQDLKHREEKDKEIERLNNIINESRRILGKYKHFSTPTEEQNSENEDIVDKAYLTLHENLRK